MYCPLLRPDKRIMYVYCRALWQATGQISDSFQNNNKSSWLKIITMNLYEYSCSNVLCDINITKEWRKKFLSRQSKRVHIKAIKNNSDNKD